jgi:hypothetical protein
MEQDFERIAVERSAAVEPSILRDVSIDYATDHYRHLVLSRYPSELDDLMKLVMPSSRRYADKEKYEEGNGALLLYHLLLHGFRSNGLKLMNVIETDEERVHTHRMWMTYLQLPSEEVETCSYDEFSSRLRPHAFDVIIMNHYHPGRSSETHIENIFQYILFSLMALKPYGFVAIEGIPQSAVHYLHSVISIFYMYPELCKVNSIVPLISSPTSTFTVVVQRVFEDECVPASCVPLFGPVPPIRIPGSPSVLVLITSAFKSTNNSNIVPERTRWRQLLHSVRTVRKKIPNAYIVVTDVSMLSDEQIEDLQTNAVNEVRVFKELEGVSKSFCESIVMYRVFQDFLTPPDNTFVSAIKLSGRYFLTPKYSFGSVGDVVCKRMRPQEVMTRYIQIPRKLFGKFVSSLYDVTQMPMVQNAEMDIEHALGRTFPEMDEAGAVRRRIDVAGFYATNGQMLVE